MTKRQTPINPNSERRVGTIKRELSQLAKRMESLPPEDQSYMLGAMATLEAVRNREKEKQPSGLPDGRQKGA